MTIHPTNLRPAVQAARAEALRFFSDDPELALEEASKDPDHLLVCIYDALDPEVQAAYDAGDIDDHDLATW